MSGIVQGMKKGKNSETKERRKKPNLGYMEFGQGQPILRRVWRWLGG